MLACSFAAPRAEDLACEPELASLALLEATMAIAIQALIARNPELLMPDLVLPAPLPQLDAARVLIALLRDVDAALHAYRELAPCWPAESGDDLPF